MKFSWLQAGLLLALAVSGATRGAAAETHLALDAGVVVDPEARRAYYSAAAGGLRALDLADGSEIWNSARGGWPLAVVDQQLVVLARPRARGELRIELRDPGAGDGSRTLLLKLPDAVHADPTAQPQRRFQIRALPATTANALRLAWEFREQPLQGALLATGDGDMPAIDRVQLSGWLQVDLAAGGVQVLEGEAPQPDPLVPAQQRIAGLSAVHQFRAADGRHLQASAPNEHPQLGTNWRWQLHAAAGGERVGGVELPVAYAPFQLHAGQLLVRLPPYAWRAGAAGFEVREARLAAFDLTRGVERWSVDLADPEYRGELPP